MQFRPSPQVPALQYIGNVEDGGAAAEAGLCTGDFLLEVSQGEIYVSGCILLTLLPYWLLYKLCMYIVVRVGVYHIVGNI